MEIPEMDVMECDVLIVGAGPAGLSTAIRLMQLAQGAGQELNVMVLEKGSEVGAHILSGCVLEPRALNELIPDWQTRGAPLNTPAKHDRFMVLTERKAWRLPTPPSMRNHGNYIISLGQFTRWLGEQATELGVQIFAGFPAADVVIEKGVVRGVITGSFGTGKDGERKESFQQGMKILAKYTVFAEGCRGSLSERLMKEMNLRSNSDPQTYAIGIKELWEIAPKKSNAGEILHTIGWPLQNNTYGGSFVYHLEGAQLAIGYVVGLDYTNPYLDPFMEFQRFKQHSAIRPLLEGGKRISYGARALNEGGYQSIPKLAFAGGVLVGCAAGFMNVPKIKGTHTGMKSGMLAAESIFAAIKGEGGEQLDTYPTAIEASWIYPELKKVRNIRPAFRFGLWGGLLYSALDTYVFKGKAPWTMRHHADHKRLNRADQSVKIDYPRPDGVVSFDRLSSVYVSNTNHEEDQPAHLQLASQEIPVSFNLALYDGPEQRYCPAGVYEFVEETEGRKRLQINAQNCVHCKTCDIKDFNQNIRWVTPEGGGGPNYGGM